MKIIKYILILSIQTILIVCVPVFWIIKIPVYIALIPFGAVTLVEIILVVVDKIIDLNESIKHD